MAHTLLSVVTFDRSVYQESCLGPRDLHSFPTRRSSDLGMDHAGAVLGPVFAWWLLASGSANVRTVIGASIAPGVVVLVLAMWAVRGGGRGRLGGVGEVRGGGDRAGQPPLTSCRSEERGV